MGLATPDPSQSLPSYFIAALQDRHFAMTHENHIFAKFTGNEIFLEQGRLLFSLLHVFASAGYEITLFDNLADKELDKYGQLVYGLPGIQLADGPTGDAEGDLYLYDSPDRCIAKRPWRKKVQVRFDMFAPFWFSDPLIMPFPMHPLQADTSPEKLQACRSRQRTLRLFFSGDTLHYGREWVRYPKPKMPRLPIINAVIEDMGADVLIVNQPAAFAKLGCDGYINKCVLAGSSDIRIAPESWLDAVAAADFFLSPPGIVMPMCHNIIEAMAVGTIPVTNYPEWLDPHLRHMEHCIVFDDRTDLMAKLDLVLQLDDAAIARLRANVIDYYQTHLRPEAFVRRVEAHQDRAFSILMYTERNVAKKASRLGKGSLLMQGTTTPRPARGLGRMAASLLG